MSNWLDLSIKERMRINKEQGFTADNLFPPGTEVRKRFDKMIEETVKTMNTARVMHTLEIKRSIMDTPPSKLKRISDG